MPGDIVTRLNNARPVGLDDKTLLYDAAEEIKRLRREMAESPQNDARIWKDTAHLLITNLIHGASTKPTMAPTDDVIETYLQAAYSTVKKRASKV